MLPDVNEAARSVEPVSINNVGEPEVVLTPTAPSNVTRTSIVAPAFFAPFVVLLDIDVALGATVSMMNEPDTDEETLPATSVCTAVIVHEPSTSVVRSHVEPLVEPDIVHVTSGCSARLAVTVTVPPFSAAITEMVGVLSLVRPSLELEPESLEVASTTEIGALGDAVSIVTEEVTDDDMLVAESDCTAVNVHTPSANAARSHVEPVVEPDTVHTASLEPVFDAVTDTVPPFSAATTRIVGVLSFVMPSLELGPLSLAVETASEVGASGAVVSITIAAPLASEPEAPGEGNVRVALFPASSAIVAPFSASEFVAT